MITERDINLTAYGDLALKGPDVLVGINVATEIVRAISDLEHISIPGGKRANIILSSSIAKATLKDPVTIYVGSCPDYSHQDGLYTHEYLGGGFPLLSQ